jgi:3-hydroxyacyl-CoA dehydrogenase
VPVLDQSKSLIHAFFGERAVSKIPGIGKDVQLIPIKRAAVVGAGTMGGGIAMNYVNAGIPVLLKETSQELLDKGHGDDHQELRELGEEGPFLAGRNGPPLVADHATLTYDGFDTADIVAEAVFEGMELKKKVFAELEKVTKPTAILASNTSTLNIDEIASATSRPQQVIGHHYFSPANVMRLLEIVRGKASSPEVIATSMDLAQIEKGRRAGGQLPGIRGQPDVWPLPAEAQFLVEEGAAVDAVDAALYEFGMAMGPLATGDLAGLDVGWRIRKEYKSSEVAGRALSGSGRPFVRNGTLRTKDRRRLVQVRRESSTAPRSGSGAHRSGSGHASAASRGA